jgi:demethylmenaquinone methyltransferase/2-methoxy-6-polyprenyl-1,4-benzoquinol methylase
MTVTPYKNTSGKKEQVEQMFDNIAHKYDFLNNLLSMGIDRLWRKKAIRMLSVHKPLSVLDIATGTGDFAIEALKLNPTKIVGVDISEGMLEKGREKLIQRKLDSKITLMKADSEKLPFSDNSFDAVTVGFGVRNFENLEKGLSDIYRVLNKNGTFVVLEFSKPTGFPFKQVYNFYFKYACPFLGKIISKDASAYTYLYDSVQAFPDGENFNKILRDIGFKEVENHKLTGGIATIYVAKK